MSARVGSNGQPPRAGTQVDRVLAYLEEQTTVLPDGALLPAERHLAERLDVSRATVREALHEFELRGRISRRVGHGTTVVARSTEYDLNESLIADLPAGERTLREMLDFRLAIEPEMAARAAVNATAEELQALEEVVTLMRHSTSASMLRELDERFHMLLATATHNRLFVSLLRLTDDWLPSVANDVMMTAQDLAAVRAGHEAILQAIGSRNPTEARASLAAHIQAVISSIGRGADGGLTRRSSADGR